MSVTKSRAAWVRGVKFSTHVHTVKTIKMPTVVLPVTLILQAPKHSILNCCSHQHTAEIHATFIVLQLHLLKDLSSTGYHNYSPSRRAVLKIRSLLNEFYPHCKTRMHVRYCNTEPTEQVSNIRPAAEFSLSGDTTWLDNWCDASRHV